MIEFIKHLIFMKNQKVSKLGKLLHWLLDALKAHYWWWDWERGRRIVIDAHSFLTELTIPNKKESPLIVLCSLSHTAHEGLHSSLISDKHPITYFDTRLYCDNDNGGLSYKMATNDQIVQTTIFNLELGSFRLNWRPCFNNKNGSLVNKCNFV